MIKAFDVGILLSLATVFKVLLILIACSLPLLCVGKMSRRHFDSSLAVLGICTSFRILLGVLYVLVPELDFICAYLSIIIILSCAIYVGAANKNIVAGIVSGYEVWIISETTFLIFVFLFSKLLLKLSII